MEEGGKQHTKSGRKVKRPLHLDTAEEHAAVVTPSKDQPAAPAGRALSRVATAASGAEAPVAAVSKSGRKIKVPSKLTDYDEVVVASPRNESNGVAAIIAAEPKTTVGKTPAKGRSLTVRPMEEERRDTPALKKIQPHRARGAIEIDSEDSDVADIAVAKTPLRRIKSIAPRSGKKMEEDEFSVGAAKKIASGRKTLATAVLTTEVQQPKTPAARRALVKEPQMQSVEKKISKTPARKALTNELLKQPDEVDKPTTALVRVPQMQSVEKKNSKTPARKALTNELLKQPDEVDKPNTAARRMLTKEPQVEVVEPERPKLSARRTLAKEMGEKEKSNSPTRKSSVKQSQLEQEEHQNKTPTVSKTPARRPKSDATEKEQPPLSAGKQGKTVDGTPTISVAEGEPISRSGRKIKLKKFFGEENVDSDEYAALSVGIFSPGKKQQQSEATEKRNDSAIDPLTAGQVKKVKKLERPESADPAPVPAKKQKLAKEVQKVEEPKVTARRRTNVVVQQQMELEAVDEPDRAVVFITPEPEATVTPGRLLKRKQPANDKEAQPKVISADGKRNDVQSPGDASEGSSRSGRKIIPKKFFGEDAASPQQIAGKLRAGTDDSGSKGAKKKANSSNAAGVSQQAATSNTVVAKVIVQNAGHDVPEAPTIVEYPNLDIDEAITVTEEQGLSIEILFRNPRNEETPVTGESKERAQSPEDESKNDGASDNAEQPNRKETAADQGLKLTAVEEEKRCESGLSQQGVAESELNSGQEFDAGDEQTSSIDDSEKQFDAGKAAERMSDPSMHIEIESETEMDHVEAAHTEVEVERKEKSVDGGEEMRAMPEILVTLEAEKSEAQPADEQDRLEISAGSTFSEALFVEEDEEEEGKGVVELKEPTPPKQMEDDPKVADAGSDISEPKFEGRPTLPAAICAAKPESDTNSASNELPPVNKNVSSLTRREKLMTEHAQRKRSLSASDADVSKKNVTFCSPANSTMDVETIDQRLKSSAMASVNPTKTSSMRKRALSEHKDVTGCKPNKIVKLPNFKSIHQQQFKRMESIEDFQKRKDQRAKDLLLLAKAKSPSAAKVQPKTDATSVPSRKLSTPHKVMNPSNTFVFGSRVVPKTVPFMSAGFGEKCEKPPLSDSERTANRQQQFMAAFKPKIVTSSAEGSSRAVEQARRKQSTMLKGVRTNRRFDLQMKFRDNCLD